MTWRVLDTFLLRRPGLAFDLLDAVADPELSGSAWEWAEADARAEQARDALLRRRFPASVDAARDRGDRPALRRLSSLRRAVGARRVAPTPAAADLGGDDELCRAHHDWAELVRSADRVADRVGRAAGPSRREAARRLHGLTARADVLDALLQLSPDFRAAADRRAGRSGGGGSAADRAHDRRLYSYLQRLAAKNETTSAFGPVTFGRFGTVGDARFGPEEPDGVRDRTAFVSFWAAVEIGRSATRSAAVRDLLPVRRLPVVRVDDGHAILPGRSPVELTPSQDRVLLACDGARAVDDLAAATGLARDVVVAAVRTLERAMLVQRRCEPCSTTFDPLDDVLTQLPRSAVPEPFRSGAERFAERVRAFSAAAPGDRPAALARAEAAFTELTGGVARRNAGRTYADRLVLFEDCHGDQEPLVLPERWRRRVESDLAVVLDLGLAHGQELRGAYRGLASSVLAGTPGMPFLEFADRLGAAIADGGLTGATAGADRLRAGLHDLVASAGPGPEVRLDPVRVAALGRPAPSSAFVSPDVLLETDPDGDGVLVLGEIHPYVFGWGLQGGFAPDPQALSAELEAALPVWGGADRLASVLHRRRHKGLVSNRFPGTFVEVTGSAHTAARRTGVAGLRVVSDGGEPVLLGPDGPLELYVGEEDHPHLRVFAPAQVEVPRVRTGAATPRVRIGDVVVQRATWEVSAERGEALVRAPAGRLPLAVAALRRDLGLPRHLYARSPSETKPLYVDLDAVFAREELRHLASLGPVTLTEMLPRPERLWLRRSGGAFTSELRLSMVGTAAGT